MANKKIQESQQESQGVALGTQGNQDITIPQGTKGPQQVKEGPEDRHIPNQERSSASHQKDSHGNRGANQ